MSPLVSAYALLGVAIVLEVIGTSMLQQSEQFTRWLPTSVMAVCYIGAFYLMSLSLRTLPVGIAYAVWSGVGIVLIAAIGYFFFKQPLDFAALAGIGLIIAGVIVINAFSGSVQH